MALITIYRPNGEKLSTYNGLDYTVDGSVITVQLPAETGEQRGKLYATSFPFTIEIDAVPVPLDQETRESRPHEREYDPMSFLEDRIA
jgi:hypothetical protein